MTAKFAVIDLFAGPGGLAEGFSSVRAPETNERIFEVQLSIEKERCAHQTLLLRSFLRQFPEDFPDEYYRWLNAGGAEPAWSDLYPEQWECARDEALCLELGQGQAREVVDAKLDHILRVHGENTILIGGPPCQAYSLAGRARNRGVEGYRASEDHRHFLYKEYIRILDRVRPAAFLMENVKGLLSSSVGGQRMFEAVLGDLRAVAAEDGGYQLLALSLAVPGSLDADWAAASPADYVIRCENFGIPQARHRVIVLGVRQDRAGAVSEALRSASSLAAVESPSTVRHAIGALPAVRSGLSRRKDSSEAWDEVVAGVMRRVRDAHFQSSGEHLRAVANRYLQSHLRGEGPRSRVDSSKPGAMDECPEELRRWLMNPKVERLQNHETRGHMADDLARYFFAAVHGEVLRRSPKADDFPEELAPNHQNWKSGKFSDRFRVQIWDASSTTITSHISKDGHYFIHPDPAQCRSLTVREAARLQTFPDDYLFRGPRTQQFVQVGNAVPPLIARKIADFLSRVLLGEGVAPCRRGVGRNQNLSEAG